MKGKTSFIAYEGNESGELSQYQPKDIKQQSTLFFFLSFFSQLHFGFQFKYDSVCMPLAMVLIMDGSSIQSVQNGILLDPCGLPRGLRHGISILLSRSYPNSWHISWNLIFLIVHVVVP